MLAARIGVDASAVAAWERGDYQPRATRLTALVDVLGAGLDGEASGGSSKGGARLLESLADLPAAFEELLPATRVLRALRLAAPYGTAANVQTAFRQTVGDRLMAGSLEVQRIEIFYSLDRLKEALFNVLAYDPVRYMLTSYCAGMAEVAPAVGGYMFDWREFFIGAYWTGIPPHDKPGLRCWGEPFATFYQAYWGETWGRGTLLNQRGGHDLSAVRGVALALGLKPRDWPKSVEEARALTIGDGAPPLI